MGKELKRVYVTQDDDGHNYVIPYELKDEFNRLSDKMAATFSGENELLEDEFYGLFAQYATGGDINLIELYARI